MGAATGAETPPGAQVGEIAAADPAGGNPDDDVGRARCRLGDLVEPQIARPVQSYGLHGHASQPAIV